MAAALAPPVLAATPQWGAPLYVGQAERSAGPVLHVAIADFNGDGHPDLFLVRNVFFRPENYPVAVLLNDGRGHFSDATSSVFDGNVPSTQAVRQVVVADFNGDGRPDLFLADNGADADPFPGYQNTLILSAPGGKLVDATANLPQVYDYTHSAAAADVNGDGTTDIYVGNVYGQQHVGPRILLNDGTGNFRIADGALPPAQADIFQNKYTGSAFADVNGDGAADLILAADNSTGESAVLLNDGGGHFALVPGALPPKPFGFDDNGLGPQPADINGDGRIDLLISYTKSSYHGRWMQVLIGNGDGTFHDETATRLPQDDNSSPWAMFFFARDLNQDGRADFGVRILGDTSPVYVQGTDGVFRQAFALPQQQAAWGFIDSTGDGSADIVAVNPFTGEVSLYPELRPGRAAPPTAAPRPKVTPIQLLANLRMTPPVFSRASLGASVTYAALQGQVTTTFTADRVLPGVRRGRACVAPQRKHRPHLKRCTRFVPVRGSFTHSDVAGPNRFLFLGDVGAATLGPGAYRLDATPAATSGLPGLPLHVRFRITA